MNDPRLRRRVLAAVAASAAAFVILSEIPFLNTRASLAPVLIALALGVIALAAAIALGDE